MSSEGRIAAPAALPGEPRWIASALYAALAAALACWPAWPGLMSYDSLYAWQESRTGIATMLWPPLHAYLFWLSARLGAGVWGLFGFQAFLLFFAAGIAANLMLRRGLWAAAALAAFAAAFAYVPELLGALMAQWRDVTTASFTLAGLAAWLLAAKRRSAAARVLAAALFGLAAALRYNAVLLLALIAPLMVWRPYLQPAPPARARWIAAGALVLGLALAWGSTQWRLPDLVRLPSAHNFAGTQEFDLIGISACADADELPPGLTDGWPISPRQIRKAYDPRHLQIAFRAVPGQPRILESDAGGEVERVWPRAVRRHLGCYLAHRAAVFVQQMGLARGAVFYPAHLQIDPNPYGLRPSHPQALAKVGGYIESRAPELWRRPFWLYLLAVVVVGALWLRRAPQALLGAAVLGGVYAYPALLFVAAPAADARYIFPSSVLAAWLIAVGIALILDQRSAERADALDALLAAATARDVRAASRAPGS